MNDDRDIMRRGGGSGGGCCGRKESNNGTLLVRLIPMNGRFFIIRLRMLTNPCFTFGHFRNSRLNMIRRFCEKDLLEVVDRAYFFAYIDEAGLSSGEKVISSGEEFDKHLRVLLVYIIIIINQITAKQTHVSEFQALLSVKASISKDPENSLSSWNISTEHCTWTGISCDSTYHRVISSDISNFNLDGVLSRDIGFLTNLINLTVGGNWFSASIPMEISQISGLKQLNLSNNIFSGSFPSELSGLQYLETLDLYNNNMSGVLPVGVSEIKNLRYLNLGGNYFEGKIPPEYGRWEYLEYLAVSGNSLSGVIPPEIGNLTKLQQLCLGYYNIYEGGIPSSIGNLTDLVTLDMAGCGLSGKIPPEIGKLQKLDALLLQMNGLSGGITAELGQLKSLIVMDLSTNILDGEIPQTFAALKNLTLLNLFSNKLHGAIPEFIGDLPELETLQLWENNFTGVPQSLGLNGKLIHLDIASNKLTGNIPPDLCSGSITPDISQCKLLTFVDLSRNKLSDSSMQGLVSVDFSYNNLSGLVPGIGQFRYFNSTSFKGNPYLCGPFLGACKSWVSNSTVQANSKGPLSATMIVFLVLGLLLCSIAFAVAAIIEARSLKKARESRSWRFMEFQRLEFTWDDILDVLKEDNIIGKGGAGIVFKGGMPNGDQVSAKRLSVVNRSGFSRDRGFNAEIQILGRIRHRHIVRLLGFCSNHETNLLVYEYMPNGSLGEVLHGENGGHLHWDTRYKIAVEAARGLCYLHHDCSPPILHRDVKSNNILLDSNFDARVADFGLAKFLQHSGTSEYMSAIAGSYGYIAPEYAYTLKIDEKSDVYSFGVVLLELLSGRKPVGDFGDGVGIVQWVREMTDSKSGGVLKILDPRLPSVPLNEVMHVCYVAMRCVEEHSIERPTMKQVVQFLTVLPKPTTETTPN
ncbi:hypothetical protein C5167_037284 [Papaver somniferum]|uniref:non-specific serine/threonine protein kinase n=1 Tax=Papaver somniferum TaxID=3469 RepID=A0A4Y7I9D9_PAPSO|nr:hypothetical protein C5167_037284 [Papaver somniferum]